MGMGGCQCGEVRTAWHAVPHPQLSHNCTRMCPVFPCLHQGGAHILAEKASSALLAGGGDDTDSHKRSLLSFRCSVLAARSLLVQVRP